MWFVKTFEQCVHALNEYANLLLVIVTIVYVLVTWRTLVALKLASLRDREASHLRDIRELVVSPLVQWLNADAISRLDGRMPIVNISESATPRSDAPLGEDQFERRRIIKDTLVVPEFVIVLYSDSKRFHFASQLGVFDEFRDDLLKFASDCSEFATRCADKIASSTTFTRGCAWNNIPNIADSDSLVAACIRAFMQGLRLPEVTRTFPAPGGEEVSANIASSTKLVAGDQSRVEAWLTAGVETVRSAWADGGFAGRRDELLRRAKDVQDKLDEITFTHSLGADCPFVGGRSK